MSMGGGSGFRAARTRDNSDGGGEGHGHTTTVTAAQLSQSFIDERHGYGTEEFGTGCNFA